MSGEAVIVEYIYIQASDKGSNIFLSETSDSYSTHLFREEDVLFRVIGHIFEAALVC